ncbi:MAG: GTP pyrophosphokinase family protein [Lachnospiraceae bacterium]|nr:GTP pyrophosphokinase family protein [Lachnospiraceae bacterium]
MRQQIENFLLGKTEEELNNMMNNTKKLMAYYRCAMYEIETKFRVLNEQFSLRHERNPIESIKTRIKSIESIQGKLNRKNLDFTVEAIEDNLNDIAGVRVICGFLDDIYLLTDCLLQQDDVKLIKMKDYIKNPKPNGYRSMHLIVEIPIFLADEKKYIRVEVQLRTIAMESWANLEHRLRYKKALDEKVLMETANELNDCAAISNLLDEKMQKIRDIIEGD